MRQGYVAEATVDNFFIVTDQALLTPPTATNLKGVTRETLLELAASLGIKADERPFTLFDVWTSKEAFICGTGAEVVPVLSVDGRHDRRRPHRPGHRAASSPRITIWFGREGTPIQPASASARGRRRVACLTVDRRREVRPRRRNAAGRPAC